MVSQVAPSNIIAGSIVWVEDPEVAWIDGEVKEIKGEKITVKCTSGKLVSVCYTLFIFYVMEGPKYNILITFYC